MHCHRPATSPTGRSPTHPESDSTGHSPRRPLPYPSRCDPHQAHHSALTCPSHKAQHQSYQPDQHRQPSPTHPYSFHPCLECPSRSPARTQHSEHQSQSQQRHAAADLSLPHPDPHGPCPRTTKHPPHSQTPRQHLSACPDSCCPSPRPSLQCSR